MIVLFRYDVSHTTSCGGERGGAERRKGGGEGE
jgi:hypothetical protein